MLLSLIVATCTLKASQIFAALLNTSVVDLYIHASFSYDAVETHFDNTALTYVTDYMVFLWMLYGCVRLINLSCKFTGKSKRERQLRRLCFTTAGLMLSYSISVLFGGTAHYLCVSWEILNTALFRMLWTVTVGMVTMAGGIIGLIGTEFAHLLSTTSDKRRRFHVIILPRWFWIMYGLVLTYVVYDGGMSYKRPVCDIFIAGCTQITPTLYAVLVVLSQKWEENEVTKPTLEFGRNFRIEYFIGFFLNAPMLPAYSPLLDSGLALGSINTVLHMGLSIAWGMQYRSIYNFGLHNLTNLNKTA